MLERGGHVCEPKGGLTNRAFTKSEKSPTKWNFTTEHHPARLALINGLMIKSRIVKVKLLVD